MYTLPYVKVRLVFTLKVCQYASMQVRRYMLSTSQQKFIISIELVSSNYFSNYKLSPLVYFQADLIIKLRSLWHLLGFIRRGFEWQHGGGQI
jgi:hypothetical protein